MEEEAQAAEEREKEKEKKKGGLFKRKEKDEKVVAKDPVLGNLTFTKRVTILIPMVFKPIKD